MRRVFYSLIISLSLLSCTKQENVTSSNAVNPLENLEWLKKKKENFERLMNSVKVKITQYQYNNQDVFLINNCVGCADALTKVYNCQGELICEFGGIGGLNTCPDFQSKAKLVRTIWKNYNELIIDKQKFDAVKTDNYNILNATVENDILTIEISSGGCSGDSWIVNLIDSEDIMESVPPQRNLRLSLTNEELCLAIVVKKIQFNISELRISQISQVNLNLEKWNKTISYNY